MHTIRIERLDLAVAGLDRAGADALQSALPGAIERRIGERLARRFARAGVAPAALQFDAADLGALELSPRSAPRAIADAIAERLVDWIEGRLDEARRPGSGGE
jgi:hypothetical protein